MNWAQRRQPGDDLTCPSFLDEGMPGGSSTPPQEAEVSHIVVAGHGPSINTACLWLHVSCTATAYTNTWSLPPSTNGHLSAYTTTCHKPPAFPVNVRTAPCMHTSTVGRSCPEQFVGTLSLMFATGHFIPC